MIEKVSAVNRVGKLIINDEGLEFATKTLVMSRWSEITQISLSPKASGRLALCVQLAGRPSRDYEISQLSASVRESLEELFERFNNFSAISNPHLVDHELVESVRRRKEWIDAASDLGDPLTALHVIDTGGWGPPIREDALIYVKADGLLIRSNKIGGFSIELSSTDIAEVFIEPNVVSSGGGFIGGGFGLKGAAEGMMEAQLLNWATQRFESWMTVSIRGNAGWLVGVTGYQKSRKASGSDDLLNFKAKLRPLIDIAAKGTETTPRENSPAVLVEQLSRLAELRAAGHITEAEFEVAKGKILA